MGKENSNPKILIINGNGDVRNVPKANEEFRHIMNSSLKSLNEKVRESRLYLTIERVLKECSHADYVRLNGTGKIDFVEMGNYFRLDLLADLSEYEPQLVTLTQAPLSSDNKDKIEELLQPVAEETAKKITDILSLYAGYELFVQYVTIFTDKAASREFECYFVFDFK